MCQKIIYNAYINQLICEKHQSTYLLMEDKKKYFKKYLFKVGKLAVFSGFRIRLILILFSVFEKIFFLAPFYFLSQLIMSFFIPGKKISGSCVAFIFGEKTLYDLKQANIFNRTDVDCSFKGLAKALSFPDKIDAYRLALKTLKYFRSESRHLNSQETNSLKVYFLYEMFIICMYVKVLQSIYLGDKSVILNSHYETWTFIASHLVSAKLIVVQHGQLDPNIDFDYKFGVIEKLYTYDEKSYDAFLKYYKSVGAYHLISPTLNLVNKKNSKYITVFIISTILTIKEELKLIRDLSKKGGIKVYIKFHPIYNYQSEYKKLLGKVHVVEDYFPDADYVVSGPSTLGLQYQLMNKSVLFMKADRFPNLNKVSNQNKYSNDEILALINGA